MRRLGRRVFLLCAMAPLATTIWAASQAGRVLDGDPTAESVAWLPSLGVQLDLRLDAFALLMVTLVSGIGVLIFVYAASYFSPGPGLGRISATFTAFAGAMLGVVLADNLLLLYVFWELTSVTSYLLIGFEDEKGSARAAALHAILVTGAGGLAMLAGFVVLGQAAGTYSLSGLLDQPPTGTAAAAGVVLVLLGAFTKSAQVPFHAWLPAAMAAPTPVSAYLHSATMVKAGVYLVARFAPAMAVAVPLWRPVVLTVGLATMTLGAFRALRQHDLKLLLAYGTISQLGFMVVLLGAGVPEATLAGAALLLAHGAFKATLFMVVGIVDHQAHTRDLRRLSGLYRALPLTAGVAVLAAASMAGLPPLLGFVSKEAAYDAFLHAEVAGAPVVLAVVVAASALTFAYSARFAWGAFATKSPPDAGLEPLGPDVDAPPTAFVAPAVVLTVATVVLGLAPDLAGDLVAGGASALDAAVGHPHLALWHGVNAALGLSSITVAAGVALFLLRRRVESAQAHVPSVGDSGGAYAATVSGLNRLADRVTGVLQNGSLPIYLGVIVLTAVALPAGPVIAGARMPPGVAFAESPLQVAVAAMVVIAAVATAVARRRLAAVLFLGAAGYGVAVLFMIQGAPDLALTQLLIETLAVVLFVLVLRHLPDRFERHAWRLGQMTRVAVAVVVGTFVGAFALIAGAARREESIAAGFLERAVPEAGGHNVVNVILVDFRGFDTFGEITVLTVAALGITSLVRANRRRTQEEGAG